MKTRTLLAVAAALGAAQVVRAAAPDVEPARSAINRGCRIAAWQIALEVNPENTVRVELSPTLPQATVVCVYQVLADYHVPLDRPAPVMVVRRQVDRPHQIY